MAKVTVKLFGVLRMDSHIAKEELDIEKVSDLFEILNREIDAGFQARRAENPALQPPEALEFRHVVLFINGERCAKKNRTLNDGDEIWLLSPASGG